MRKLYLSLPAGLTVCLESNQDFACTAEDMLLLQAHVPGALPLADAPASIDISLRHRESELYSFEDAGDALNISSPWKGRLELEVFLMLYAMVRRHFLKAGLYAVHGACLRKKDPVLIIGHSGSGKTSILLELVERFGYQVFSGNKTVVSCGATGIIPVAGTKTITVRRPESASAAVPPGSFSYTNRHAFRLPSEAYCEISAAPIKTVALVRLNDRQNSCRPIESAAALHRLYPYFLDAVNADVVFAGGAGLVNGEASGEEKERLLERLKLALDGVSVYDCTGTADSMAAGIAAL